MLISIIGGGGKTTTLFYLANKYAGLGKAVLVSTTTKMFKHKEYEHFYSNNLNELKEYIDKLDKNDIKGKFKVIGLEGERKISSPSDELIEELALKSDILLLEADGSRGLPAKYHLDYEPVIHKYTDKLVILFGLDALDKSLEEVCHRFELASKEFNISEKEIIDIDLATKLIKRMYDKACEQKEIDTLVVLNKADNENILKKAEKLKQNLYEKYALKSCITSNTNREIDI